VFDEFRQRAERHAAGEAEEAGEVDAAELSPRELEVLDCLVMGRSNKEIGDSLFITEQTVKNHLTSVLRKLAVDDRVAALRYAVTHGWAELGPQAYAAVERNVGGATLPAKAPPAEG
jgi:DNA-binding NarL/FixJ family response regulator